MIVFVSAEIKPEHKKEGVTLVTPHSFNFIDWSKVEDVSGDDYYVKKAVSLGAKTKNSKSSTDNEERQLRDEYERLYGRKAGGRMSLDTLRQKVEEASE